MQKFKEKSTSITIRLTKEQKQMIDSLCFAKQKSITNLIIDSLTDLKNKINKGD